MQTHALPSGPAVFTIAAPEGIRGNIQEGMAVSSFSQQDYDKFLQGYKSQYKELSFWVEEDAVEGTSHASSLRFYGCKLSLFCS